MIHTDVKPGNLLVSPTGHATLIDFGFVQTPAEVSRWATRPLAGTLAYIARVGHVRLGVRRSVGHL